MSDVAICPLFAAYSSLNRALARAKTGDHAVPKAKLYNWDSIPSEVVRKGVSRKGFRGENMLLVMNRLEPGFEPRPHSHPSPHHR